MSLGTALALAAVLSAPVPPERPPQAAGQPQDLGRLVEEVRALHRDGSTPPGELMAVPEPGSAATEPAATAAPAPDPAEPAPVPPQYAPPPPPAPRPEAMAEASAGVAAPAADHAVAPAPPAAAAALTATPPPAPDPAADASAQQGEQNGETEEREAAGPAAPAASPLPRSRGRPQAALPAAMAAPDEPAAPAAPGPPLPTPPLERAEPVQPDRTAPAMTATAQATPPKRNVVKNPVCRDPRLDGVAIPPVTHASLPCGIAQPVRLNAIAGIGLSTPVTLDCNTAGRLASWLTGIANQAAEEHMGSPLAKVWIMGSYACRTRNNRPGGKVSEHASGRAVDIGGFWLRDGRKVTLKGGWGQGAEGTFLAQVRRRACGLFHTVLGPGSDRFHHDHLHLDTSPRGGDPYCR